MIGQRTYTNINCEWDGATYKMVSADWHETAGTVAACKGGDVAKEQMREQTKLQKEAFSLMKAQQQKVEAGVGKYLSGNQGFDPQQLAIMRAQFLNQMGKNYNSAGSNVRTALARRGSLNSSAPVGGDAVRGLSALEGSLASDTSSGLANIDLSNLSQALTNKFNAASLINGQAAQLTSPISSFGSGAASALEQYVKASNQGFTSAFANAFGGALGKGFGQGIVGGVGQIMPGSSGQSFQNQGGS
jgi:hypothetical protein